MQYTQEQVARFFEEHGCKLLSQYKNVKSKLRIIAACGHEATVSSFEAARRPTYSFLCSACSPKVSYSDEDVAAYVTGQGCELLSIERVRHPNGRWYKTIRLVGTCGHEYTMAYEKFRSGESISGEDVVELCRMCGIAIHLRTIHNLQQVIVNINGKGSCQYYRQPKGKRKPQLDGCYETAGKLYEHLQEHYEELSKAA